MKLFLFDIDGTLVRTHGAGRESTKHAMTEVFGTYGGLATHHFGGKTDWLTLTELLPEFGITHEEIERRLPEYNVAMERHLSAIIGRYPVEACPGSLDLLESLRRRDDAALGIVTGNVSNTAPVKLRAAGFDPAWFPIGAFGHEAKERNNLPALAMARASTYYGYPFTPGEVLVIGDTAADISCARALGAVAIAVETGFAQPGELAAAQPDYLLRDLTEFSQVFA